MNIGFAMCGSFCTFSQVIPIAASLAKEHNLFPIFSTVSATTNSRFGEYSDFLDKLKHITGNSVWASIEDVEPIGPKKLLDVLVIAPCTGNTLAKLAHGIADSPVTMAAKSQLRNAKPVVLAVSTNDGLGTAAANIGTLLARKNYYFVPFGQDAPLLKPLSLVADFQKISDTIISAVQHTQIQPILL